MNDELAGIIVPFIRIETDSSVSPHASYGSERGAVVFCGATSTWQRATSIAARTSVILLGLLLAVFPCGTVSAQENVVRVTTWNLEWFPNGSSKEVSLDEQTNRIKAAADVLRPLNPDIILLQEVRDEEVCQRLGEAILPGAYSVAVVSRFSEPFHSGPGRQQVAIMGKGPAQAAWSEKWKSTGGVDPPRGFAFAWYKIKGAELGVYAVHLKSNLIMKADKAAETAKNIQKREVAAEQLLEYTREVLPTKMPSIQSVIIGGDFNTNLDQAEFAAEKTIPTLTAGSFRNCLEGLPAVQRVTHPGSGPYPDATFDYLFAQNAVPGPPQIVKTRASDHLPVTVDFRIGRGDKASTSTVVAAATPQRAPSGASAATPAAGRVATAARPQYVTVIAPVKIKIPYGETQIPQGTRLALVGRDGTNVRVNYLGDVHTIPAASTDVR